MNMSKHLMLHKTSWF